MSVMTDFCRKNASRDGLVRVQFKPEAGFSLPTADVEVLGSDDHGIVVRYEGKTEAYIPWSNVAMVTNGVLADARMSNTREVT